MNTIRNALIQPFFKVSVQIQQSIPDFPEIEGNNPKKEGTNLLLSQIFLKTALKWRNLC